MFVLAVALVGCMSRADAPIPVGYRDKIEGARASLDGNWDGWPRPTFAFAKIICRADGGLLVVFTEHGGRHAGAFGVAMQGPDSPDEAGGWGGGYGVRDLATDSEVRFFFRDFPEAPCPDLPR